MADMLTPNRTAKPGDSKGFQRMFAPDRLTLGVFFPIEAFSGGDRSVEFPAFGVDFEQRSALFRDNLRVVRTVLAEEFPTLESSRGTLAGTADLVPKPITPVPMLVTGHSGQPLEWIAKNADGWITYPRGLQRQAEVAAQWRAAVGLAAPGVFKPFVQSFYVDLSGDPDAAPTPIHLGFRGGRHFVQRFLEAVRSIGVNP